MTNYGLTYSIDPPKTVEITGTKVFLASNITPTQREDENGQMYDCYSYELIEYDKDEYFNILAESIMDIGAIEEGIQAAKIILGVED